MPENPSTTAFLCPNGHLRTSHAGQCPEHGTELKPATHQCPNCGYAALQAGDCPFCDKRLQGIEARDVA